MDTDLLLEGAGDGDGQRVQPAVHARDLEPFRHSLEARRLEVMEADAALMMRLSVEGFDGTTWRRVSEALVEYGFTVMRSWVVTGHVFVKLREKGRPLDAPVAGIPRDEALELAEDTVAEAIVHFRDAVLRRGIWDPAKGASLTTYFIGNCLLFQFPNQYRTWRSARAKRAGLDLMADVDDRDNPVIGCAGHCDPQLEVVGRDNSRRVITEILGPVAGETNKTILRLRAEGYGVEEIAELLGLEYKAVESRIYRARESIRARRRA